MMMDEDAPTLAERVAETEQMMIDFCRDEGISLIGADHRVLEEDVREGEDDAEWMCAPD